MPTFPTPRPITAFVETAAGSVRLVATDSDETVVDVRARDDSRAHDVRAHSRPAVLAPGSGRHPHRIARGLRT